MEVQRKAPAQVNFSDVLPMAIPSSSNRRKFFPNNGDTFSPTGTNIIRIDVNADSMLDASHSYLEMTIRNDAAAGNNLYKDIGCPQIKRLRIESGGVTLEDIHEYGRLYGMLELSQFSVDNFTNENGVLLGQSNQISKVGALGASVKNNACYTGFHDDNVLIGSGLSRTFCIPMVSALLNCEKYVPLILANAGITLEITLCPNLEIGVCGTALDVPVAVAPVYSVSKVCYNAHLVDLDRSFYDALRMEMAVSGSIALNGQTWKHYSAQIPALSPSASINIPARQKSIKSIFSTFRNSTFNTNAGANLSHFSTCVYQRQGVTSWNYRIGSVNYPQSAVAVSATNLSPSLSEVLKAFGKLGDISTNTCMNPTTYSADDELPLCGEKVQAFVIGYDLEAFQKSALESGVNTAERALPITLEIEGTNQADAVQVDSYVVSDWFGYVNADGTITPSS